MTPAPTNPNYAIIGGDKVSVRVHSRFWWLVQVEYTEARRWAYPEPYTFKQKIKWIPKWKLI